MVRSFYPFDASRGITHVLVLVYQFYWVLFMLIDANSLDVLFCSWLLFACEQLQHLKQIMKPLMELSATLDTVVPNSSELFKVTLCNYPPLPAMRDPITGIPHPSRWPLPTS